MKDVAGIFCAGNGAGRLVRGLMLVRGALVPESSGSKSRRVTSTHERSSPVYTGSSVSGSPLRARFMCVPLYKVLPEMSPLLLCKCCQNTALCQLPVHGVLPLALSSTAKAGAVTIQLGHKMSTLAPFLVRRCLNHVTAMIYKRL